MSHVNLDCNGIEKFPILPRLISTPKICTHSILAWFCISLIIFGESKIVLVHDIKKMNNHIMEDAMKNPISIFIETYFQLY